MVENINRYLTSKKAKIKKLKAPAPIIMQWMGSPTMQDSLEIIDKHVDYLLNNRGGKKLGQWFLAGDINFNSITAERYIIRYLKSRNENIVDNLTTKGVDAHLKYEDSDIGIEVTTLNSDVGSWILSERLMQYLVDSGYLQDKGLELT